MSDAFGGTRASLMYRLAPQVKMINVMTKGTAVQNSSRPRLPCTASGPRFFGLRRYFTAKIKMQAKIRVEKKAVTEVRNRYCRSTPRAMVDAASGNNGSSLSISLFPAVQQPPLSPDIQDDKCRECA